MTRVPAGITLLICIPLFAQKAPLTRSEIEQQIHSLQTREQQLREQIAEEQASVLSLKKKIEASRERIVSLRKKKLEVVGLTENSLAEFSGRVQRLEKETSTFLSADDDRFLADSINFQSLVQKAQKVKDHPASRLRSLRTSVAAISMNISTAQQRYTSLRKALDTAAESAIAETETDTKTSSITTGNTYTVMNSDGVPETLFSIAGKVYGDPNQWVRIYQANKDVLERNFHRIRDRTKLKRIAEPSDLIFPGQVLVIPR
ncbi:MAG: LysM peptidoglycan-binding domain-containing protein [Chitinispirillaceae bacterium]|nr:LysM peptidoglycan-binding domain-containing protein [Chitinispirillaceae bacterium]